MQHRAVVALLGGIASSVISGEFVYSAIIQVLNDYADWTIARLDEVFWQCGELYNSCQENLIQQANDAQALKYFAPRDALIVAVSVGIILLLAVPAVTMSVSTRKPHKSRYLNLKRLDSSYMQKYECLVRISQLDDLRDRGEISEAAHRRRRTEVIKRTRKTKRRA